MITRSTACGAVLMDALPTVVVRFIGHSGDPVTINERDYDPTRHTLLDNDAPEPEPEPEPEPKGKAKRSN